MTYSFGNTSKTRLFSCHGDICKIMFMAIDASEIDFTIVCGSRGEEEQEKAYAEGNSKAHYGESPHNATPSSLAVDICPYIDGGLVWDTNEHWWYLSDLINKTQSKLLSEGSISNTLENGFDKWGWDRPHWQVIGWKGMVK